MKRSCSWLLGRVAVTIYHIRIGMKETGSFCPVFWKSTASKVGHYSTQRPLWHQEPRHQNTRQDQEQICVEKRDLFCQESERQTTLHKDPPTSVALTSAPKIKRNHLSGSDSDKAVMTGFQDCLVWKWPTLQPSNQKLESSPTWHPAPDNLASRAGHWDSEKTLPVI